MKLVRKLQLRLHDSFSQSKSNLSKYFFDKVQQSLSGVEVYAEAVGPQVC